MDRPDIQIEQSCVVGNTYIKVYLRAARRFIRSPREYIREFKMVREISGIRYALIYTGYRPPNYAELAEAMAQVAPVARRCGISLNEFALSLNTLSEVSKKQNMAFIEAEKAGEALREVFKRIKKDDEQIKG